MLRYEKYLIFLFFFLKPILFQKKKGTKKQNIQKNKIKKQMQKWKEKAENEEKRNEELQNEIERIKKEFEEFKQNNGNVKQGGGSAVMRETESTTEGYNLLFFFCLIRLFWLGTWCYILR